MADCVHRVLIHDEIPFAADLPSPFGQRRARSGHTRRKQSAEGTTEKLVLPSLRDSFPIPFSQRWTTATHAKAARLGDPGRAGL